MVLAYDKTNQTFGQWTILEELGGDKVVCRCSCGTVKINSKYSVVNGRTQSCGCLANQLKKQLKTDTTNQTFNDWTVIKELGKGKVLCRCSCGVEKICVKNSVTSGKSKSCGHNTNKKKNLVGQTINEWTITKDLGYGFVECRCSCGTITTVKQAVITGGYSKSCGCKKTELMQNTLMSRYGEITANKVANPRELWQIETINNKDKLIKYIRDLGYKPTVKNLVQLLNVNEASIGRTIKQFGINSYIDITPSVSEPELQVRKYIESIYTEEVQYSIRGMITGRQELDIYIPNKKLAIEFNGDYWHSNIYKDSIYHQAKTIDCVKQGIRLIHIFEYEWKNKDTQAKLKQYLNRILADKNTDNIYARNTEVTIIDSKEATDFCEKYHLQGSAQSSINLGIKCNNKLLGVMTFGIPRFNNEIEYELIRLCYKDNINIIGGSEKLFKYFINNYNPTSIVSYCDISKFTGNIYLKLGFKSEVSWITKPNYKWVNSYTNDVLSRYQTQKHKLLEKGLGTPDQTEDEIMEDLGYLKIYDAGNLKFIWQKQ